jgi:hypothetical protein
MAAKTAFLLASRQLQVSEDWVVGLTGIEPVTHRFRSIGATRSAYSAGKPGGTATAMMSSRGKWASAFLSRTFTTSPRSNRASPQLRQEVRTMSHRIDRTLEDKA